jgi:hypothetical protein
MEDHRKIAVSLILPRYLINAKKIGYEQAYAIIWEWLDRWGELRRLKPSRSHLDRYVVKYQRDEAQRSKRLPMKLETLKEHSPELYKKLIRI